MIIYFILFLIFYWKVFALQYCVGFYHISTWISHRYTHVPSLLSAPRISHPIHPSRLSPSTGLISLCHIANSPCFTYGNICFTYGNMCVSVILSQFLPPFPSLTVSTWFPLLVKYVKQILLCFFVVLWITINILTPPKRYFL